MWLGHACLAWDGSQNILYHGGLGVVTIPTLAFYFLALGGCSGHFLGLLGSGRLFNVACLCRLIMVQAPLLAPVMICSKRTPTVVSSLWPDLFGWRPLLHPHLETQGLMRPMCLQAQNLLDTEKTDKLAFRVERKWKATTSKSPLYFMLFKTCTKVSSFKRNLCLGWSLCYALPCMSWSSMRQL